MLRRHFIFAEAPAAAAAAAHPPNKNMNTASFALVVSLLLSQEKLYQAQASASASTTVRRGAKNLVLDRLLKKNQKEESCPAGAQFHEVKGITCDNLQKGPYVLSGKISLQGNIDLPSLFPKGCTAGAGDGVLFRVEDGTEIDCNGFAITGFANSDLQEPFNSDPRIVSAPLGELQLVPIEPRQKVSPVVIDVAFEVHGKAKFMNCAISNFEFGIHAVGSTTSSSTTGATSSSHTVGIEYGKFFDITKAAIFVGDRKANKLFGEVERLQEITNLTLLQQERTNLIPEGGGSDDGRLIPSNTQSAGLNLKLDIRDSIFEDSQAGVFFVQPGAAGEIKVHRSTFTQMDSGVVAINFDPDSQIDLEVLHTSFSDVKLAILNSFLMPELPTGFSAARTLLEDILIRGLNKIGVRVDYGRLISKRVNVLRNQLSPYASFGSVELFMSYNSVDNIVDSLRNNFVRLSDDVANPESIQLCGHADASVYRGISYDLYLGCGLALDDVFLENSAYCGSNPTLRQRLVLAKKVDFGVLFEHPLEENTLEQALYEVIGDNHASIFVPAPVVPKIIKNGLVTCQDAVTTASTGGVFVGDLIAMDPAVTSSTICTQSCKPLAAEADALVVVPPSSRNWCSLDLCYEIECDSNNGLTCIAGDCVPDPDVD